MLGGVIDRKGATFVMLAVAVALAAGVGIGLLVGDDADGDGSDDTSSGAPSALFVQQATSGELRAGAGSGDVPEYTLILEGVGPRTAYFTDRPERDAGTIRTKAFVTSGDLFAGDPPNAALVLGDPDGEAATEAAYFVELRDPIYDATTATLRYSADPIDGRPSAGLRRFTAAQDTPPAWFGHASVFIDSAAVPSATSGGGSNEVELTVSTIDLDGAPEPDVSVTIECDGCSVVDSADETSDASGDTTFTLDLGTAASAEVVVTVVASGIVPITDTVEVMAGQPLLYTVVVPPTNTPPERGSPGGPDVG